MTEAHQTDEREHEHGDRAADRLDPAVGPHSPAEDDVTTTATDVTTAGVVAARADDERREREAQATPPVGRGHHPDHPRGDPATAQAADVREVD